MKRFKLSAVGIGLVLLLAACGAVATPVPTEVPPTITPVPTPVPAEATPAPATGSQPTLMAAQVGTLGSILVDGKGMTLYVFSKDTANTSNCSGSCATAWPPLTVPAGTTPAAGPGVAGTLGVIQRADGTSQVTLDGKPLYYYAKDANPGDATGQGFNGLWYVVQFPAGGY